MNNKRFWCTFSLLVHYMDKGLLKPGQHTHMCILNSPSRFNPLFYWYINLHSSGKALHYILQRRCGKLYTFSNTSISEVMDWVYYEETFCPVCVPVHAKGVQWSWGQNFVQDTWVLCIGIKLCAFNMWQQFREALLYECDGQMFTKPWLYCVVLSRL